MPAVLRRSGDTGGDGHVIPEAPSTWENHRLWFPAPVFTVLCHSSLEGGLGAAVTPHRPALSSFATAP